MLTRALKLYYFLVLNDILNLSFKPMFIHIGPCIQISLKIWIFRRGIWKMSQSIKYLGYFSDKSDCQATTIGQHWLV